MQTRKLPTEIRRMKNLGRYSAAMAHNGDKAERTWRTINASDDPAAADLMQQLMQTVREAVRQVELAREAIADMGCLLSPDPKLAARRGRMTRIDALCGP